MKKVLHITSSLKKNGTETFIMNVFRNIDRTKISFDFLVFSKDRDGFYEEAISLGAEVFYVPTRRNGLFLYYKSLNEFYRKNAYKYSAVHFSACSLTTILPIILAWKYKIPIRIVHAHNSGWSGLHNYILHFINKRIVPYFVTDKLACSTYAGKWFFGNKDFLIVKNGIEINKYSYNAEIRKKYREDFKFDDSFVIGHVGRFESEKNHMFMLNVFKELLNSCKNSKLVLVGTGSLFESVKKHSEILGISDKVVFTGQRNDVSCLLQAFDCFFMPSLYEGLPFVLVEAQCAGLPVVASDTISKESKLTEKFVLLDLNASKRIWVDNILKFTVNSRETNDKDIISKGYSITETIKIILSIYNR